MPAGKIKKLVQDKGFGFIQTDNGEDVFFHHSIVADMGFDEALFSGLAINRSVWPLPGRTRLTLLNTSGVLLLRLFTTALTAICGRV
jgi:cold shock CspA family protein